MKEVRLKEVGRPKKHYREDITHLVQISTAKRAVFIYFFLSI